MTLSFSACLAALLPADSSADGPDPPGPTLHFVGSRSRRFEMVVTRAVGAASSRLADEHCAEVLGEFRDASGKSLTERLAETGQSPSEYLEKLLFLDGDSSRFCQSSLHLLGTQPGGRFILVCGARFARFQFQDPSLAAILVLHEGLHTLGLPENPPSSAEITRRVWERCAN